jgi:hypothetical protein
MVFDTPGVVGWGGNGGFHMVSLAAQMRPKAILLVGMDMRLDLGVHWHGPHGGGLNNPSRTEIRKWRKGLDAAAPVLRDMNITVINCSKISALEAYPKLEFKEAIDMLDRT